MRNEEVLAYGSQVLGQRRVSSENMDPAKSNQISHTVQRSKGQQWN
jgi:hypothetical protein